MKKVLKLEDIDLLDLIKKEGLRTVITAILKNRSTQKKMVAGVLLGRVADALKKDAREECIECENTVFNGFGYEVTRSEVKRKDYSSSATWKNLNAKIKATQKKMVEKEQVDYNISYQFNLSN